MQISDRIVGLLITIGLAFGVCSCGGPSIPATFTPTALWTLIPTDTPAPAPTATDIPPTATTAPTDAPAPTPVPVRAVPVVPVVVPAFSCAGGCATPPDVSCDIKGNISVSSQERIYHVRGQAFYDETEISPEYGERWFCTEEEAVEAGWRKAKR